MIVTHGPTPSAATTPAYYRQKRKIGSDVAYVEIDHQRFYLGPYDTAESRERYHKLIAEWEASGRFIAAEPDEITVMEIANQYLKYAKGYYVKNGHVTSEPENIRLALRPVLELYGSALATEFGPRALKAVRENMISRGWVRTYINRHVDRIKRMFRWAVCEEMVSPSVDHGLRAVPGLRRGRSAALESERVKPAPIELVEATKKHVARQVEAMIDLQLLTGARPGEVVLMRPCDLDRSRPVWVFRPKEHKTEHHGNERLVFIGPKAQEIIEPFLQRPAEAFCFSPLEAERERYQMLSDNRSTPMNKGNHASGVDLADSKRRLNNRYTTGSYRRAIVRGIEKAFPLPESLPKQGKDQSQEEWIEAMTEEQQSDYLAWRDRYWWHPHQLRHNAATIARRADGLETAQVFLGHSKADVTQIYAERDMERAMGVAMKIG